MNVNLKSLCFFVTSRLEKQNAFCFINNIIDFEIRISQMLFVIRKTNKKVLI